MSTESAVLKSVQGARHRYAERLSTKSRKHLIGVGLITGAAAAFYSVYSLVLYATYRDSSYDLVIFDQAVRSYSRFHLGISAVKGLHNGLSPNFSVLGDHFSPIDIALAPLYWIYDGPQTLLIAQAILFALAIPFLWRFTRRAFASIGGPGWIPPTAAYLACIAYAVSWPIAAAVAFDYHEVAFAPVLIAIAVERLQAGRLRSGLIALGFLLLVKEDLGFLVAGLGFALLISFPRKVPRQRLVGLILMVVGVGYSLFAVDVLIPLFGGKSSYYWAYPQFGDNVPQVIVHVLRHPRQFARNMFSSPTKVRTLKWLVGAFAFLPFLSPLALAAVPLLVERMEAYPQFLSWWGMIGQYNAFIVVILVMAAADGAARVGRWGALISRSVRPSYARSPAPQLAVAADNTTVAALASPVAEATSAVTVQGPGPSGHRRGSPARRLSQRVNMTFGGIVGLALISAICAASLVTVPRMAFGQAFHASFYRQTAQTRAAAAADAVVPSGVVVAAANDLGPELSRRDTVLMWDGDGYTPPFAAPWVVADVGRHEMTFKDLAHQRALVRLLQAKGGYKVVFQRDGYLVLRRPGPPHLHITSKPMTYGPPALQ